MKWPWTPKNQPKIVRANTGSKSDQLLEQITQILFPPLVLQEETQEDGLSIKFHVDYSVDTNLDAALMDLQSGLNDEATHNTISKAITKLMKVRRMLGAFAEFDEDVKYIVVDSGADDNDIEEIVAQEQTP